MVKKMRYEAVNKINDTFTALYRGYYNDIYRFTYSLTGNAEEAEDFTQETFIKLHHRLDTGEAVNKPKGWLYRVAANLCYNHLKRQKLFGSIIKKESLQVEVSQENIETDLMRKQEIAILRRAVTKLPARDRLILTLYKNGFSTGEIAGIIDVKVNSIGKILARSVKKLSKIVKEGDSR
jgi:RNA polymerase sigma-70 factor (ECF subfamily)